MESKKERPMQPDNARSTELISVIMPTYNATKTIRQSINSVLNQTYKDLELLIADDCSTDGTYALIQEIAKDDNRIICYRNETNQGASLNRHNLISKAKGRLIAFLDCDDLWEPTKLEKQIELIKDADIVYTGSAFIDNGGNRFDWTMHVPTSVTYKELLKQNVISNSSTLTKKDLFLANETVMNGIHEDFACWLGMLKNGAKAVGIDEPLLIYRLSPKSKSGNKFKSAIMNYKTYRAIGINPFSALLYEVAYLVNGLRKYKHLLK